MADQTTTTTSSPWDWLIPQIQGVIGQYQTALGTNPPGPYPGPTVAPWAQNQTDAADYLRQIALNGTPALNAANNAITGLTSGSANPYATKENPFQPLNNPYLEQMIGSSNADIGRAWQLNTAVPLQASMAQQGAFGGSGFNEAMSLASGELARQIAQNEAQLRGGAYTQSGQMAENQLNRSTGAFDTEQARRLQAAGLGLASQGTDLAAGQALFNVGGAQQGQSQNVLDAMQNYWRQTQAAPFAAADVMKNSIYPLVGAGGTSTTEANGPGTSPIAYASLLPILGSLFGGGKGFGW